MSEIAPSPLVVDIARRLAAGGSFVVQVTTGRIQSLVDVRWAARHAAQLLGRRVRITTALPEEIGGKFTVTVVLVDADPEGSDEPVAPVTPKYRDSLARRVGDRTPPVRRVHLTAGAATPTIARDHSAGREVA
jgi:hypothetical protein